MKRTLTLTMLLAIVLLTFAHRELSEYPVYKNPTGREFPILAWYSIIPKESCKMRYEELREAGFNLSTSDFKNLEQMQEGIRACRGTGVKQIVSCPEMDANPEKIIPLFRKNKMTGGYFLRDEPTPNDFPALAQQVQRIRQQDDRHMIYLDLFPTYVPLEAIGTKDYREYVERSIREVKAGMLSYDHYPIMDTGTRPDFYENLEIVSSLGRQYHQPFWAFALVNPHLVYPVATRQSLRYQIFSNLAYGAQGLEYFTYWIGVILPNGKRSEVYDLVSEVNHEVHHLEWVFLGSEVESVQHTGDSIPQGTHPLTTLPHGFRNISSNGTGVLVSHFRNGKNQFLMILNRDYYHRQQVTIDTDNDQLNRVMPDGRCKKASLYNNQLWLEPGDYLLYQWK